MSAARGAAALQLPEVPGLCAADFARLASILNTRLGIQLPPSKRSMLDVRLRGRIRALGFADHDAYCRHLFSGNGLTQEMQHLVDAVTTNKTDFFREPRHFDALRDQLIPELLIQRREQAPLIKLWSAASSIGAEAYTAAMVMAELADTLDYRFAILGTDVSSRVLMQARQAIYAADLVAPVPRRFATRFLLQSREADKALVRISPELRRRTTFFQLNLMDQNYNVDRDVDIVMLRNVLIYFDKTDQEAVITRLLAHIRPGGFLLLGHSEAMIGSQMGLDQVAPAIFRKP